MRAKHAGMSASMAQRRRRGRARLIRIAALILGLIIVIAAFSLALGPRIGLPSASQVYEYAGDKWFGDSSGMLPYEFNKDVGYPGPFETGKPAHFADEMRPAAPGSPTLGASPIQTAVPGFEGKRFQPFEHMGPYTPYKASVGFGVDESKYGGTPRLSDKAPLCQLKQVHILHRHGARYPTTGAPPEKLRSWLEDNPNVKYTGKLAFLNEYTYRIGRELLVPLGRQQLYDSGAKAAIMYGQLVAQDAKEKDKHGQPKTLFARAGSQQRIVDSGLAWLNGFSGNDWKNATSFEIQIEAPAFNTTTAPEFACPAADKPGTWQGEGASRQWINTYLRDAVARLQPDFGGAKLTAELVYAMQQLCPYDTVAFGHSDFCQLFTESEWLDFEYSMDLKFAGNYGGQAPLGPGMGVGWVNELVSRLERKPWDRSTQTSENATLNADARTFPLDRRFYVDFTHDSTITAVLAALQLPNFNARLDPASRDDRRGFITSQVVPFAARLILELFECSDAKDSWVRLKLNDAVVPLSQLSACERRDDGLCSLTSFLRSQERRNDHGWWDICKP